MLENLTYLLESLTCSLEDLISDLLSLELEAKDLAESPVPQFFSEFWEAPLLSILL
jgi:hypothetical protein